MKRAHVMTLVAALLLGGLVITVRSTGAQQPESVNTRSGFHVERVDVRGACVVIVSRLERTGSGSGDYLAAVPC